MTHLDALQLRLSNERMRLDDAKTEGERKLRSVWIRQIEKEIAGEIKFEEISIEQLAEELKDFQ
jgi:hypothetical protein